VKWRLTLRNKHRCGNACPERRHQRADWYRRCDWQACGSSRRRSEDVPAPANFGCKLGRASRTRSTVGGECTAIVHPREGIPPLTAHRAQGRSPRTEQGQRTTRRMRRTVSQQMTVTKGSMLLPLTRRRRCGPCFAPSLSPTEADPRLALRNYTDIR
jgi:hypothetical protein